MAWRKEPLPLSLVLETVNVTAGQEATDARTSREAMPGTSLPGPDRRKTNSVPFIALVRQSAGYKSLRAHRNGNDSHSSFLYQLTAKDVPFWHRGRGTLGWRL